MCLPVRILRRSTCETLESLSLHRLSLQVVQAVRGGMLETDAERTFGERLQAVSTWRRLRKLLRQGDTSKGALLAVIWARYVAAGTRQGVMGLLLVVLLHPHLLHLTQRLEHLCIELCVSRGPIEPFGEGMLVWLAQLKISECDPAGWSGIRACYSVESPGADRARSYMV